MKTTLTLRRSIWQEGIRTRVLNQALSEEAVFLEEDIKGNIDASQPQGKLRRLSSITARNSAKGIGNLRRGSKSRVIIGANVYRASAPGQPPAKRTGNLYRGIKVRRVGNLSIRASVDAKYARYLDNPNILNRPFFKVRCQTYFKERFTPAIRSRVNQLINNG